MKVFNKKICAVVVFLLLIESCFIFLSIKSYMNKDIKETKEVSKVNKEMFSMYVENKETGKHEEYESDIWPSFNTYELNTTLTNCVDNKGGAVTDVLKVNGDNTLTVTSNKTIFCYLYFDLDKSVYAKVINDYNDSNGAALLEETSTNKYPVYYYTGNITNNNILFGNFCWKMVITTETGGVKLIYNGVPTVADDGTKTCDNTGTNSQLASTSAFNVNAASLAYVGYMYNSIYENIEVNGYFTYLGTKTYAQYASFYYGDTITWDGSTYILSNSDGSSVTSKSTYNIPNKRYLCNSTKCKNPWYKIYYGSSRMYYLEITSGNYLEDYYIKKSDSIIDNEDGTYSLVDPTTVLIADLFVLGQSDNKFYLCKDLISDTCSDMYYSPDKSTTIINYHNVNYYKYKYGNSVEYKDGQYYLIDTKTTSSSDYNIDSNHYTCFNTTGICENVYYIYQAGGFVNKAYYIKLSIGENIDNALNKMLSADNVNNTNSTIKSVIDNWYKENILGKVDEKNVLYSDYIENAKFCANRSISKLGGWEPTGKVTTGVIGGNIAFNYNLLECENKTDQFTLKKDKGGIEGYGNNALDYPIALLSYKEASLAGSSGYLKSGSQYWLLSPAYNSSAHSYVTTYYNSTQQTSCGDAYGVRPVLSLSNEVEIVSGDGSVSSPYQVDLPIE